MKCKTGMIMLAAVSLCLALPAVAGAETIGIEREDGSVSYYQVLEGGRMLESLQTAPVLEAARSLEVTESTEAAQSMEVTGSTETAQSVETMEKAETWRVQRREMAEKQQMKESLAYLEKYGVTYDTEEDQIYYQRKKVRCIEDAQKLLGTVISYWSAGAYGADGETDLLTVRNEQGELTGVREASAEEFAERSEEMKQMNAAFISAEATDVSVTEDAGNDAEAIVAATVCEAVSCGREQPDEWEKKRIEEYKEAGILQSRDGGWLWNGEPVYLLLDDNGGMYINSTERTSAHRIYLYVARDPDGSIAEVSEVDGREALAKRAACDEKQTES